MKINHIGIWVDNLDLIKEFYIKYFNVISSELYHNKTTGFKSYFLSFDDNTRIEIMSRPDMLGKPRPEGHIAISLGTKENVDSLTSVLGNDGYKVLSYPRTTGDGYYESVLLDPENNKIELTV